MERADPLRGLSRDLYFTVRLLGTLLWLVAYLLDESFNLVYRTTLLALLFFGVRLYPNGAPSLSGGALCCATVQ